MIDNPEKAARLLAALKEAVPFRVALTERLIKHLRGQHDAVAEQTEHIVSDLSYAGDEGGIVCHMVHPEGRESTCCLPDPGPCASFYAVFSGGCRLSKASRQEAEEARPTLRR